LLPFLSFILDGIWRLIEVSGNTVFCVLMFRAIIFLFLMWIHNKLYFSKRHLSSDLSMNVVHPLRQTRNLRVMMMLLLVTFSLFLFINVFLRFDSIFFFSLLFVFCVCVSISLFTFILSLLRWETPNEWFVRWVIACVWLLHI
jgi:hypothetical protein